MPTYEYVCKACKRGFEVQHGLNDPAPANCEECGGELRRIFYPPGLVFKGGGFYSTENRFRGSDKRDSFKKDEAKSEGASSKESAAAGASKPSRSSSQSAGTEKSA